MTTSTYTIHEVLAQSRRIGVNNATQEVITAWLNERHAALRFDPHEWSEIHRDLSPEHREASRRAYRDAYDAARRATTEIMGISARMRSWRLAGAEDRRFLAEVRCLVVDADHELRLGNLSESHRLLHEASKRLTWVVDGRQRNSPRHVRRPNVELADEMHTTVAELNALSDLLGAAA